MSTSKPIVTVNEGKIRGVKKQSQFSGKEYFSFFGVPYGQSTAKRARFSDPVKAKPWANVLDASVQTKEGCAQLSLRSQTSSGSEDCLYNNIHTPKLPSVGEPLKPVIVLIHPGGYFHGSPETWYYGSPEYIMHHDVVYVCVAYRLHILGFLNLELEECSGNQGLKDIILSLKWLKENIDSFGGDPNNVTLLGSSSGAVGVHCMMLSPAAEGLFHKAVIMGGYIFNPLFAISEKHTKVAMEIAKLHHYNTTNEDENTITIEEKKKILAFLKRARLDHKTITHPKKHIEMYKNLVYAFPSSLFGETIDDGAGENSIFPVHPRKLIKSTARIPLMFGMCEREAAMAFGKNLKPTTIEPFYKSYRQNYFGWGYNIDDNQVELIRKEIESFYLKGYSMEFASLSQQIDIQTDVAFSDCYDTLLDIVASDLPSSVYVYKFQFEGDVFTMKDKVQSSLNEPIKGTFHAADFSYWAQVAGLWGMTMKAISPRTIEMIETFTKLISTFARTGNPNYEDLNVEWKPSTPEKPCYLSIDNKLHMVDGKLNGDRLEFWQDLKKRFYKEE